MDDTQNAAPSSFEDDHVSPWQPGECLCGIPNCVGHRVVNGKILVKGHPALGDFEAIVRKEQQTS